MIKALFVRNWTWGTGALDVGPEPVRKSTGGVGSAVYQVRWVKSRLQRFLVGGRQTPPAAWSLLSRR